MIDLREAINRLASEDEAERIYAAEDVGYANQPEGVEPLLARLPAERSRAVREAIFSALTQMENAGVVEGAIALLDSEDAFLRNAAVEMLQARSEAIGLQLLDAFDRGGKDKRKFILDILARKADPQGGVIYDRALRDVDLNVVITAVENIGNTRMTEFRERVADMISASAHPMLVGACLETLASIGDAASVQAVGSTLEDVGAVAPFLRAFYIKLLGARGGPEQAAVIAGAIGSGLDTSVLNALTTLRRRHAELALPASLTPHLRRIVEQNVSPVLAYQAVRLLGGFIRQEGVTDFLERCLAHSEKAIRIGAVQVLSEAGGERGHQILERCLAAETDEEVLQCWSGRPMP